jgi:hypothetical protein
VVALRHDRGRGARACRSKNIDQNLNSANPAIQRFVGATGDIGKMLGLDNRWAYNIVKQVGNYGESLREANLTPLGFERGLNRLWTQGGLLYAPPIGGPFGAERRPKEIAGAERTGPAFLGRSE